MKIISLRFLGNIWKIYNPDIDNPIIDGVLAGNYMDESLVFVGSGTGGVFNSMGKTILLNFKLFKSSQA